MHTQRLHGQSCNTYTRSKKSMRMSWKVQNVLKSKEKGNPRHKTSATQQY